MKIQISIFFHVYQNQGFEAKLENIFTRNTICMSLQLEFIKFKVDYTSQTDTVSS